ncbi:MAG: UDP-3-O-acyl-N-acetylglucosamine deacetylase [Planctomycetota bacterium]
MRYQNTIAAPVAVEGFGYWSGLDVRVEFRPAPPNTGLVFVRADLGSPRRIKAEVANRVEVPRRTNLHTPYAVVEMVEHVMATLAGLQIDNCEIWVDRAEMPGCDGSSQPFVDAVCSVARVAQPAARETLAITEVVRVGDENCWVEARPASSHGLSIRYLLDYGEEGPIGRQSIDLVLSPRVFRAQLAAARTFILREEAEWLRRQGLGERVTCGDLLVFNDTGPVNNELRFHNECVRHKTADLVGDLALADCDIQGRIVGYRSGHRLNAELVRTLLREPVAITRGRCRVA